MNGVSSYFLAACLLALLSISACSEMNDPRLVCVELGPERWVSGGRGGAYRMRDCLRQEVQCIRPLELYTKEDEELGCRLPRDPETVQ